MKRLAFAAVALIAAAPSAALCFIAVFGETTFDGLALPQNGQLRIVGAPEVVSPGALTDDAGTQHLYTLGTDELGFILVPDAPLPAGTYALETSTAPVSFTITDVVDDTAPAAPVFTVEYTPQSEPFSIFPTRRCAPTPPDFVLRVNGADGDILIVNGVAEAVVRDGRAEVGVSAGRREVQLLDLAGNLGESATVDVEAESPGGCSQGASASSLGGLLALLGLRVRRRVR